MQRSRCERPFFPPGARSLRVVFLAAAAFHASAFLVQSPHLPASKGPAVAAAPRVLDGGGGKQHIHVTS